MIIEQEPRTTRLPAWLRRAYGWLRIDRAAVAVAAEVRASIRSVSRWELALYGTLIVTAATMRLWDLDSRAVHHDESLHSYFSWKLYQLEGFKHIPMMHGPFQFEANALVFWLFGDSDYTSRLFYALMGTVLVILPFFLRHRIGRLGALIVSVMLAFSPAMFYFSRFARNDILMAVWTLGLVISMWRYIDEGKHRYLYISSALLALAFATKENAFMITAILGLFLFLLVAPEFWAAIRARAGVGETSVAGTARQILKRFPDIFGQGWDFKSISRPATFLLLLVTLTLPQWSAAVAIFQDSPLLSWTNLNLVSPEGSPDIGSATGGALVVATALVVTLFALSVRLGFLWNWSVWWRSALVFYVVWVLLYTTFFTNPDGAGSGIWQSFGYWIVQQGQARGDQPWYYYFVITSIYEYLPLFFGVIGIVYYLGKNDDFRLFLVFWAMATFALYTIASEKMPWLLVSVSLPLIVLSGTFLSDLFRRIQWVRLIFGGGWLLLPGVPLMLLALWRLAFYETGDGLLVNVIVPIVLGFAVLGVGAVGVMIASRTGRKNFLAFGALPVAVILMALTIRTGVTAAYQNGDIPVEMIVYTQTSPDITNLMDEIEKLAESSGEHLDIPVAIDQTSAFAWPWVWYLRDYNRIDFSPFNAVQAAQDSGPFIQVVHSRNRDEADNALDEAYNPGGIIKHRWWFPEDTYRGLTFGKFFGSFIDREAWRNAMDYFLHREGVFNQVGSEDAHLYYSMSLPDVPSNQ